MRNEIAVVGSLNMDLVVHVGRRPKRGETVLGSDFFMSPGGKGANQAYAARRLGAAVGLIGKVGSDMFGDTLRSALRSGGVDVAHVEAVEGQPTGIAQISVDDEGDNSIIVAPGANLHCRPEDIRKSEEAIKGAKLLMVQLEIPLDAVLEATMIAKRYGVPVLLDPAPARPLPDELYRVTDYIVPNASEMAELTGIEITDKRSAIEASSVLRSKGVRYVFAKLGDRGVVVSDASRTIAVGAYRVAPVDTTAAGDAFAGALGAAIVAGMPLPAAAQFANAVGALTVTKPGAQTAMPSEPEVKTFMERAKPIDL